MEDQPETTTTKIPTTTAVPVTSRKRILTIYDDDFSNGGFLLGNFDEVQFQFEDEENKKLIERIKSANVICNFVVDKFKKGIVEVTKLKNLTVYWKDAEFAIRLEEKCTLLISEDPILYSIQREKTELERSQPGNTNFEREIADKLLAFKSLEIIDAKRLEAIESKSGHGSGLGAMLALLAAMASSSSSSSSSSGSENKTDNTTDLN
jgi:hypothetical protein